MIGDALMDSLGGALGGSTGAGTLPPPRAKSSHPKTSSPSCSTDVSPAHRRIASRS